MTTSTGKNSNTLHFESKTVHAGVEPDPVTGTVNMPIHHSAAFQFKDAQHGANLFGLKEMGYSYSRLTNPTVDALQKRLAALDGGVGATCTSSGHAAQLMLFYTLLNAGEEYVASKKLYGGSISQIKNTFPRSFGWTGHMVDPDDVANFKAAITPKTKFIFIESCANPSGAITDIRAIADIANEAGIPLIVDNTMASPYLCRPFEHGAHIVTYSTTKFLSGHGHAMGGVVIDSGTYEWSKRPDFYPNLAKGEACYGGMNFAKEFGKMALVMHNHAVGLRDLGMCQQPMNAWLTLLGLETLHLRMPRHCENALKVAQFLEAHPKVARVNYSGLPSSPYKKLQEKYMPLGAGSVFSFALKGGFNAGKTFVEGVRLASHLANLGDTRTLVIHPASTTHSQLSEDHQIMAGAGPDTVRLSIGVEHADDIINDFKQALDKIK